jgi:hypothetical protein
MHKFTALALTAALGVAAMGYTRSAVGVYAPYYYGRPYYYGPGFVGYGYGFRGYGYGFRGGVGFHGGFARGFRR